MLLCGVRDDTHPAWTSQESVTREMGLVKLGSVRTGVNTSASFRKFMAFNSSSLIGPNVISWSYPVFQSEVPPWERGLERIVEKRYTVLGMGKIMENWWEFEIHRWCLSYEVLCRGVKNE